MRTRSITAWAIIHTEVTSVSVPSTIAASQFVKALRVVSEEFPETVSGRSINQRT